MGALKERLLHLLASKKLPMVRQSKGKTRSIDLRPHILDAHMGKEKDRRRMMEAGISGRWEVLYLRHELGPQATLRLGEFAQLLWGKEPLSFRAVRLSLRGKEGVSVMGTP